MPLYIKSFTHIQSIWTWIDRNRSRLTYIGSVINFNVADLSSPPLYIWRGEHSYFRILGHTDWTLKTKQKTKLQKTSKGVIMKFSSRWTTFKRLMQGRISDSYANMSQHLYGHTYTHSCAYTYLWSTNNNSHIYTCSLCMYVCMYVHSHTHNHSRRAKCHMRSETQTASSRIWTLFTETIFTTITVKPPVPPY